MDYICPVCKEKLERDPSVVIPHTDEHIVDAIKKGHPEWIDTDGLCPKCLAFYHKEMRHHEKK